jgi:hypothetical protein
MAVPGALDSCGGGHSALQVGCADAVAAAHRDDRDAELSQAPANRAAVPHAEVRPDLGWSEEFLGHLIGDWATKARQAVLR